MSHPGESLRPVYCGTCRSATADQGCANQCTCKIHIAGVASVLLFGSDPQGSNPDDVDIAVRLGENFSHGDFNYFGRLEDLEQQLTQLPGCKVDVIEDPVRKARMREQAKFYSRSALAGHTCAGKPAA